MAVLRLGTGAAAPKHHALSRFHAASTLLLIGTLRAAGGGALNSARSRAVDGPGTGAERQLAP